MYNKAVLFIDDEPDFRDVMTDFLGSLFSRVLSAGNGSEAIRLTDGETFDLIICDLNMPLMRGDEFLRKLRAKGNLTPVIFLTGNADKDVAVAALRLGAVDVLDKPITFEALEAAIGRIFEIQKREQDLTKKESPEEIAQAQKMIGLLRAVNEKKLR